MIDLGLAKKYITSEGMHLKENNNKPLIGTVRYCSSYIHEGIEASRRDDLISLFYVLAYLLNGKLPW
jgi:casein kinase 1